ncbi:hypothetical protein IMSAG025_02385 [Muribaculaceae bacterium]|nr:hypothetical protein IMSAG025_02385 [Muribaculaceae bacterium]
MGYSLMIAPFDFANHNKIAAQQFFDNYAFFELTPKRAKEYFLWFKNEIPNRITMLWEYMKEERPESQPFDYSPESLIPLWDWYETKIKQVPKTKKEIEYSVSKYPKWMEENIRKITMSINSLYSLNTSHILKGILQSHILMKRSTPLKIYFPITVLFSFPFFGTSTANFWLVLN